MSKKISIFTDADLDGAGCVQVFKWLFPDWSITCKAVNERTFKDAFDTFIKSNDFANSERIYICDLNVLEQNIDLLNHIKIFYIDHHEGGFIKPNGFTGNILKEASPSCTSLVCDLIKKESLVKLTNYQKLLISLIDDYDSYTLKHATSLNLNTVFFSLQGDRISQFCNKFKDGFRGFDAHQNNIIRFHTLKVNQIFESLETFSATISLGGTSYKIVSAFADYAINEVANHILKKHNGDIAIVINSKTNAVSFRKQKTVSYDISQLAKKIADGNGNANAAGGKLTPAMLSFSNLFKPV